VEEQPKEGKWIVVRNDASYCVVAGKHTQKSCQFTQQFDKAKKQR